MKKRLLEFLNTAFEIEDEISKFENSMPKLYGPAVNPVSSNLIVLENDCIRSAIGVYNGSLQLGNSLLQYQGIGNVAVDAAFRNQGYMQSGMQKVIEQAVSDEMDFLFLGGQRQRYQNFGFEHLGMEYQISLTQENLWKAFRNIPYEAFEICEVNPCDTNLIEKMYHLHEQKPLRSHRTLDLFYDTLCTWSVKPKAFFHHGEFAGYYTGDLQELSFVNPSDFPNFIRTYMKDKEEVEFHIMPWNHELLDIVCEICEDVELCENEMFHIINYKRVLHAFLTFCAEYYGLADGEQNFLIHGFFQDFCLHVRVQDNIVTINDYDQDSDVNSVLECSHLEAMQLFFGIYSKKRLQLKPNIRSWFPLPLYIDTADQV